MRQSAQALRSGGVSTEGCLVSLQTRRSGGLDLGDELAQDASVAVLMVDLDDTLVDRHQVLWDWAAYTAHGYPDDDGLAEWLVQWDRSDDAVRDRRDFLSGVRARLRLTESVDELFDRWPFEFGGRYRLDDPTRRALDVVRQQSISVVIVTNGSTAHQQAKLDAIDAPHVVDRWVISEQVGVRKPGRRIFELAAELVRRPLEGSWMIGDIPTADIEGAVNAGLNSVWVNRHSHVWAGESKPRPRSPIPRRQSNSPPPQCSPPRLPSRSKDAVAPS
jgi:HAD superfamily hydrolase (TIGR01549 family)